MVGYFDTGVLQFIEEWVDTKDCSVDSLDRGVLVSSLWLKGAFSCIWSRMRIRRRK